MSWLLGALLLLAAVSGTLVVATRRPKLQVFALSANGLVLAVLFLALQAPDVAFSELAVGSVITPLLFLATLTSIAINRRDR